MNQGHVRGLPPPRVRGSMPEFPQRFLLRAAYPFAIFSTLRSVSVYVLLALTVPGSPFSPSNDINQRQGGPSVVCVASVFQTTLSNAKPRGRGNVRSDD
jgi:hypothetical protein